MNTKSRNEKQYTLSIAWLYPQLMSTYGDRGNIICLQKRCEWRNITVDIVPITRKTPTTKLSTCDLIFMGGAQDRQQQLVNDDALQQKGPVIKRMIEKGIPALFVCAAYQFVGNYYKAADGTNIPGLGILDLYTMHPGDQRKRLVGNVAVKVSSQLSAFSSQLDTIVGFENHGGRTYLGDRVEPFGMVIKGFGNNGEDGCEGALYKNVIGSYLHGPLLPKNPHIADWLLAKALEVRYNKPVSLSSLDDALEWKAHTAAQQCG